MPTSNAAEMTYRNLGRSGVKVSAFGLGGWTTFGGSVKDAKLLRSIHRAAFDAGINFFDIADVYSSGESERAMGKCLAEFPRHELIVSSKLYFPFSEDPNDRGLSRKHIFESIERSLKRIGTDYLDLYFCHRFDEETPVEETARAMDDLVHQGKLLYWGTSEWTADQLREAHSICDRRNLYAPQVEQPQYSLLARHKFETDTRTALDAFGMGAVVWSPLGSGLLTGKYDNGVPPDSRMGKIDWLRDKWLTEERLDRVRRFRPIADQCGCSRTQLALAWAVNRPGVSSVILGATSVKQLQENLGALSIKMDSAVESQLHAIFPPDGVPTRS